MSQGELDGGGMVPPLVRKIKLRGGKIFLVRIIKKIVVNLPRTMRIFTVMKTISVKRLVGSMVQTDRHPVNIIVISRIVL